MSFFLEKSKISKSSIPVKVKKGTLDNIAYAKERDITRIYLKEEKDIYYNETPFASFSREKFDDAEEWSGWMLAIYDLNFPSKSDKDFGKFVAKTFRKLIKDESHD